MDALKTFFFVTLGVMIAAGCQGQDEGVAPMVEQPSEITGDVYQSNFMLQGWYESDPEKLARLIDGSLALAQPVTGGTVHAIVSPHAGHAYCYPQAAAAFKAVEGRSYDRVVVIGLLHRYPLDGFTVHDVDGLRTPLGTSPVDREVTARLRELPGGSFAPAAYAQENSTPVILPWVQRVCGLQTPLVEINIGSATKDQLDGLADALAELADDKTLFVFSTDMSHFHEGGEAEKIDGQTIDLLEAGSYEELAAALQSHRLECCGTYPLMVAFRLAERLDWPLPRVLSYGHSGQVTGDYSNVVGYMGAVWATGAELPERSGIITPAGQRALLQLARRSLETYVRSGDTIEPPLELVMTHRLGAFVTLHKDGMLRGCIGNMVGREALPNTVIKMAIQAAAFDPRFPKVTEEELDDIDIEISVLTPFSRCPDRNEVVIGRDGIMLQWRGRSGVFLPQVPVEQGWDLPTYLEQICYKAGVPATALDEPDAQLFTFTAQVFGEEE